MSEEMEFTVKGLVAWLETQPPDKHYDWTTANRCLLGQWCASKGMKGAALKRKSIELGHDDWFYQIALYSHQHTFGAALERARVSLAQSQHHHSTGERT